MSAPFFSRSLSLFIYCIVVIPTAFAQQLSENNHTTYSAGYREYQAVDSSRRYKPGSVPGKHLSFRPEAIDVWYPAQVAAKDRPLDFNFFLEQFEQRANTFQDSVTYKGLAAEMMQHFTIGNTASGADFKTQSYLNVPVAGKGFPLVIYFTAYNGMAYENVPLFEKLAQNGYMVVSISSIGRYPGNMTTQPTDVLEQAVDAEFALHLLANKGADTSRVGLLGYSYGGIAATLFALRHPNVEGFLSLDGSERHYYGRNKSEDNDFDALRNSVYRNVALKKIRYTYLESDHKQEDGMPDSVYHLLPLAPNNYARLIGAEHEDFSSVSDLTSKPGSRYALASKVTLDYFDQVLKNSGQAFYADLSTFGSAGKLALTPSLLQPETGRLLLKGRIIDAANGAALPYVSIGIPSGNCGTVSDDSGRFVLPVTDTLANRTVRISSLGYQPQSFTVKGLLAALRNGSVIQLKAQTNELKEVSVIAAKPRTKIIGNTSQSKFFNVGFPLRDLGSEVGIRVALGKKTVLLRQFNFNISNTRMDSCTFRLNIYRLKDGMPAENLLSQNIIKAIGHLPGAYTVDLYPYHIKLDGTILVSLEWIGGRAASGNGAVFFSAGLLSSSYHRKTTEADWVKFKGLGAAFNLKVQEE